MHGYRLEGKRRMHATQEVFLLRNCSKPAWMIGETCVLIQTETNFNHSKCGSRRIILANEMFSAAVRRRWFGTCICLSIDSPVSFSAQRPSRNKCAQSWFAASIQVLCGVVAYAVFCSALYRCACRTVTRLVQLGTHRQNIC